MQFKINDTNYARDFVQATVTGEPQDGANNSGNLQKKILTDANLNPKATTSPDLQERIRGKYIANGSDT